MTTTTTPTGSTTATASAPARTSTPGCRWRSDYTRGGIETWWDTAAD